MMISELANLALTAVINLPHLLGKPGILIGWLVVETLWSPY